MGRIDTILLLATLAIAVYTDLTARRIPNSVIGAAVAVALGVGWANGGNDELTTRIAGFSIGLLVFLPFFALRLVGAGDAKLLAAVGAFAGASNLLPIVLYTLLAGGVLGLAGLVANRSGHRAVANLRLVLFSAAARAHGARISPTDLGLESAARIPYAVAIAAGVVIWLLTRN